MWFAEMLLFAGFGLGVLTGDLLPPRSAERLEAKRIRSLCKSRERMSKEDRFKLDSTNSAIFFCSLSWALIAGGVLAYVCAKL